MQVKILYEHKIINMNKCLLIIIYFLAWIPSPQSQILYGTSPGVVNSGEGTINKFIPAANKITVSRFFETIDFNP